MSVTESESDAMKKLIRGIHLNFIVVMQVKAVKY